MANLTTCDPGNIVDTIQELKREKIRCSVIGLAAEVRVCRLLTQETGGIYGVILDDVHYKLVFCRDYILFAVCNGLGRVMRRSNFE